MIFVQFRLGIDYLFSLDDWSGIKNLKDAMADLETIANGIQTHGSYWVSGRHIQSIITNKSRKYILTTKGQHIPVSRRKLSDVRQYIQRLS